MSYSKQKSKQRSIWYSVILCFSVLFDAFSCFINTMGKIFACFGTIAEPSWKAMYCSHIHAFENYLVRIWYCISYCKIITKIEHVRLKLFLFSVPPGDSGLSDLSNASWIFLYIRMLPEKYFISGAHLQAFTLSQIVQWQIRQIFHWFSRRLWASNKIETVRTALGSFISFFTFYN